MFGWSVQGWLGILIMCFGLGCLFDPRLEHVPFMEYIGLALVAVGAGLMATVTGWYGSVSQYIDDDDTPNAQPGRKIWTFIIVAVWFALIGGKEYLDHRDKVRFREAAERFRIEAEAK